MQDEKEILKKRAALLARAVKEQIEEKTVSIATFTIDAETYGFENTLISEVLPLQKIVKLPCAPSFVRGIINVRSRIVSVIDPKHFFELSGTDEAEKNHIVVLHNGRIEVGLLVGEVSGVVEVDVSRLDTGIPTLTEAGTEFLQGVSPEGIIIVDAEKLLSSERIIVNDKV